MLKTLSKQKKVFVQYAIIIFLILSTSLVFITSFLTEKSNELKKRELLKNEQTLLETENIIISNRMNRISSDLLYLVDSFRINESLGQDYSEVEKHWMAFSSRKMIYDQIRFIDIVGNEVIRVNNNLNGAILIDKKNSQNKKDRYYFKDTIKLEENQIYISKLDLNVENNEIEEPIKPMIRISTPYYSKGDLKGIIILNYSANDILNQLKQVSSSSKGNVFMLNSDGYWLYNSQDSEKEWSFMYEDKADISFANEFPTEWEGIQKIDDGYQITGNGLFVNTRASARQVFNQTNDQYSYVWGLGNWVLVSFIPAYSKEGSLFTQSFFLTTLKILKDDYYFYILILLISVIISALMAINKNKNEEIKYFSEYDEMTGTYNRRAGFKKLSQLYKKNSTKADVTSICFIDINGLKEVNDSLGHEAGDELIESVVEGIKKNTRENDFIARLGGDEFLIIFEGLDKNKAESIWKRIVNDYDYINENENRKYLISVSHGIESFGFDSNQFIDAIVNSADQKMYNEKRNIKKDLKVLRDI